MSLKEHTCPHLGSIDLLQVSEGVVETPGEVEGQEAEHERRQHNDDHLHRLLLGTLGRQTSSLALWSAPSGLQKLPDHEAVTHHDHHEGQSKHEHRHDGAVHQEVVKEVRAGGVVAGPLILHIPDNQSVSQNAFEM